MKKLPNGCDHQGRYPEAAEACTEIGQEDVPYSNGLATISAVVVLIIVLIVGVLTC